MQLRTALSLRVTRVSWSSLTAPLTLCSLLCALAATTGCAPGATVDVSGTGGGVGTGGSGAGGKGTGGATGTGGMTGAGGAGTGGAPAGTGGASPDGGPTDGSRADAAGSGGMTGAGGAPSMGGAGGALSACMAGAPTPPSATAAFPFPQHRASGACLYPTTCADDAVTAGWKNYQMKFIVDGVMPAGSLRVQRPENSNDTVSEGISYGMLFAVYMNDKATFDKLWMYEQGSGHLDTNGLMNWHLNSNGTVAMFGTNSATDADEDIGFALVMADKQWGGYTTMAKDYLAKVLMNDFGTDGTIKGGDTYVAVNPSYMAPAFYRVFADYTGAAGWSTVVMRSYTLLGMAANTTTGLVPDWVSGRSGPNYTYDATRTPYRIAVDACWFGDKGAQMFSTKLAAFFAGIGAANIKDGYNLNGTATGTYNNASFVGPAGVGAMAGAQQKLVDDAYAYVAKVAADPMANYYDSSWAMFSLLMMTGNFVNFASP